MEKESVWLVVWSYQGSGSSCLHSINPRAATRDRGSRPGARPGRRRGPHARGDNASPQRIDGAAGDAFRPARGQEASMYLSRGSPLACREKRCIFVVLMWVFSSKMMMAWCRRPCGLASRLRPACLLVFSHGSSALRDFHYPSS